LKKYYIYEYYSGSKDLEPECGSFYITRKLPHEISKAENGYTDIDEKVAVSQVCPGLFK